jgi:hypothetical protein
MGQSPVPVPDPIKSRQSPPGVTHSPVGRDGTSEIWENNQYHYLVDINPDIPPRDLAMRWRGALGHDGLIATNHLDLKQVVEAAET